VIYLTTLFQIKTIVQYVRIFKEEIVLPLKLLSGICVEQN